MRPHHQQRFFIQRFGYRDHVWNQYVNSITELQLFYIGP
jgi:hypothetical protein